MIVRVLRGNSEFPAARVKPWPRRARVFLLCVLAALLFAVASAEGLPAAQTAAASNITATEATLSAIIYDSGSLIIDCGFEYGVSEESLSRVSLSSKPPGSLAYTLTSLTPKTQYSFRAYASNAEGIVYGNLMTFTTKEPPSPPVVNDPEIAFGDSSATLTFELETPALLSIALKYGENAKALNLKAGCSLSGSVLTAKLSKLEPGKTYYYECAAANEGGAARGTGTFVFEGIPETPPAESSEAPASPTPALTPEPATTPEPTPEPAPEPTLPPAAEELPEVAAGPSALEAEIERFALGEARASDAQQRIFQANLRLFYDPKDPGANLAMALALCDSGKSGEALFALRASAVEGETYAPSLLLAGCAYLLEGDPASALDALSRIPEEDAPPHAHYLRAMALLRLGRPEDALSASRRAVAFASGDQNLYAAQLTALHSLGRYEELLQATGLADGNAFAIGYRLAALKALGRGDSAGALAKSLFALPEATAFERYQKAAAFSSAGYAGEALALAVSLKSDAHYLALLRGNPFFRPLEGDIRWQFATNDYRGFSASLLGASGVLLALVAIVWAIGRPKKKKS